MLPTLLPGELTLHVERDRGVVALPCVRVGRRTHQLAVPLPGAQDEGAVVMRARDGPQDHARPLLQGRGQRWAAVPVLLARVVLLSAVEVPGQQGGRVGVPAVGVAFEPVRDVLLQRDGRPVPSVDFWGGFDGAF